MIKSIMPDSEMRVSKLRQQQTNPKSYKTVKTIESSQDAGQNNTINLKTGKLQMPIVQSNKRFNNNRSFQEKVNEYKEDKHDSIWSKSRNKYYYLKDNSKGEMYSPLMKRIHGSASNMPYFTQQRNSELPSIKNEMSIHDAHERSFERYVQYVQEFNDDILL